MNKKIKECENIEFLPQKFQEELKEQSDKNILSTLCYFRFKFSDYASANNGFFFTSLEELAKESLVDVSTVKRRLALMQMKKYIERKSGTNHQCTHYKLSKEIEELLGIEEEENSANEPLDKISKDKLSLDKKSSVKLSLDETSQVESRQDNLRIENNNILEENNNKLEKEFEKPIEEDKGYSEEEFESFKAEVDSSLERCINENELSTVRIKLNSKNFKENARERNRLYNRLNSYIQSKYESLQHQCAVATSSNNNYDDELPF